MKIEVDYFENCGTSEEEQELLSPDFEVNENISEHVISVFNEKFRGEAFASLSNNFVSQKIQKQKFSDEAFVPQKVQVLLISKVWPEEDEDENLSPFDSKEEAEKYIKEMIEIALLKREHFKLNIIDF